MHGACNEAAAKSNLRQQYWFHTIYNLGMVCLRSNPFIVVSPHGIAFMTAEHFADLKGMVLDV